MKYFTCKNMHFYISMAYSHAKVQGQQLVGSEDRVETNGQTHGGTEVNAVGKYVNLLMIQSSTKKSGSWSFLRVEKAPRYDLSQTY